MLRRAGLSIDSVQNRRFAEVLALLGFERRDDVKAAGRAVFVRRREERAVYDAAFDLFWRASTARGAVSAALPRLRQNEGSPAEARFGPDAPPGTDVTEVVDDAARIGASVPEALRTADFAGLTPAESRASRNSTAAGCVAPYGVAPSCSSCRTAGSATTRRGSRARWRCSDARADG